MKIALIDNYDSFTYNLVHLLEELDAQVEVLRNDRFDLARLQAFDKILLSPGPGIPQEAGQLLQVVQTYAGLKPILGICLGHQAIGQVFGGRLCNLREVFHGVQTPVQLFPSAAAGSLKIETDPLFEGLPSEILVGRYHSWVVDAQSLPPQLAVTAIGPQGEVMAMKHRQFEVHGLQFHPESVLTPDGKTILGNWLRR